MKSEQSLLDLRVRVLYGQHCRVCFKVEKNCLPRVPEDANLVPMPPPPAALIPDALWLSMFFTAGGPHCKSRQRPVDIVGPQKQRLVPAATSRTL